MSRRGDARTVAAIAGLVAVVSALLVLVWWHTRAEPRTLRAAAAEAGAAAEAIAPGNDPTAAGGIDGTVIDASGALRPGAAVAVRGERVHRAVVADLHGSFAVRGLPVGEYVVSASTPDGAAGKAVSEVVANGNGTVTVRLSPISDALSVSGHVHDILGGSVGGAEVWIGGEQEGLTVIVHTGPEGDFAARVRPGKHELRVRASGYAEAADELVVTGDTMVDLVIHPASILRGVVVLADGKRAPGARVRARHGDSAFEAMSDGEGRFEIRDLPAGQYDLDATTSTDAGEVRGVNLAPADSRDLRIHLAAAAFVTGRVQSTSGEALAGAKIGVRRDQFDGEVKTGADGRYSLPGMPPGLIDLRTCAPGHVCTAAQGRVAASGATTMDVTLRPGASLRVRVVDKNGKPVRDASAYLANFSGCDTGAEGDCVIDNVSPRKTMITVEHATAGYAKQEITVPAGETQRLVRLVPGATVRGTVRWDDGKPAAAVHVFSFGLLARTRADGRYELANVKPGPVTLRAAVAMDLGERALAQQFGIDDPSARTIPVRAGEVHENVDLVLPRKSKRISGLVVGSDGVPVPYARVGLTHDDPVSPWLGESAGLEPFASVATYSGANGAFTIESVSDGKYVVWADADEQPIGRRPNVAAGSERVRVELPASAVIEGDVEDDVGAPMSTFVVRLGDLFGRPQPRASDVGHFVIAGLAAGHYSVTVEAYGAKGAGGSVMIGSAPSFDLAAGEHRRVAVVVRAPLTVTGRVVSWPDMKPAGGVELGSQAPVGRSAAATTDDGSFRLAGLIPGTLKLSSFDVDGQQEDWTRELVAGQSIVDIGDLAFAPGKLGYASFQLDVDGERALVADVYTDPLHALGLQKGDEIVSIGGSPVATLGPSSLEGLLEQATPEVPIVVRKNGATGLTTLHPPASPGKSGPGR